MDLVEAVEERLHARNPKFVHTRFVPGRCPYCGLDANLRAMIRDKLGRGSPKAVEPS